MSKITSRRAVLRSITALAALSIPCFSYSQSFPSKPIRMIVPFPPGGPSDAMGRLIAQMLSERLSQNITIENRAGAGSMIGIDAVAKATPDGYTLGLATADSFSVLPAIRKTLPFDPIRSFTPLALMARLPNAFAVHPDVPAKSISELVALARAKPGSIRYASPGLGTLPHFAVELLATRSNVNLVHVPYKGGGLAVTDAIGGHVQMVTTGVVAIAQFVKEGRLRALAVTSETRSSMLPDVPTMIESGFPGYVALPWFGVTAPSGLPPEISKRLGFELEAIAQRPDFQQRLTEFGGNTGQTALLHDAFQRFQETELNRWKQVVIASNYKIED